MRELDPFNFKLSGNTDRARQLTGLARTQGGFLRAMLGNLPFGRLRKRYPDGSEIDVTYHYGQYVARIFVPGGEEEGAVYYPLFMMRRPDLDEYQDEILLWDHAEFPNTALPLSWRSRMARPETYDAEGNAVLKAPREMCGDVDWTGWNGLSLSWDGHKEPPTDEELPYGGLSNRYFFNYAMAGRPHSDYPVDAFSARLYFNGKHVRFGASTSWTSQMVHNLLGAAILTVNDGDDGAPKTYIYYVRYQAEGNANARVVLYRREFSIASGTTSGFTETITAPFYVGSGSGRYAGPFHFNASGTVAKGIVTKVQDGGSIAGHLHIVTFTIDKESGNVTVEDELAVADYQQVEDNEQEISQAGTANWPPADFSPDTLLLLCGQTGVYSAFTRGYIHRSHSVTSTSNRTVFNLIAAVDWVGDEPVYLRLSHDTRFDSTSDAIRLFVGSARQGYSNAGPAGPSGLVCNFVPDGTYLTLYTGDWGIGLTHPDITYPLANKDTTGADAEFSSDYTRDIRVTTSLRIEGAYEATVFHSEFVHSTSLVYNGTRSQGITSWTHTVDRNEEPLRFDDDTALLGLDLRADSFIHRVRYRTTMAFTNSGSGNVESFMPYTEATRINYRYASMDAGEITDKAKAEHDSEREPNASYVFPLFPGYDPLTGNMPFTSSHEEFGMGDVYVDARFLINYFCRPSYEPAALAVMNFKPGLNEQGGFNKPLAVFYSYTIDQSEADVPAPNEVYAGIVSNVEGMSRTQEELRELFGDGELPYATQDLEQDFRPVRFGGFNKPVNPDVPLFIPLR